LIKSKSTNLNNYKDYTKEQTFEAAIKYSAAKQTLGYLQAACLDATELETIKEIIENREITYETNDGLWIVEFVEARMLFGDDYIEKLSSRTQGTKLP
jgi:hypothetical protein